MRVLVIGSGGREHALVWKLAQSRLLTKLYAAPGNPGMADLAELLQCSLDPYEVVKLATAHAIDLVVVGPEQPLVAGVVDSLRSAGIMAFGPHAEAAQLEGSKRYAKEFMERHGVPTAAAAAFDSQAAALGYLKTLAVPPVVKKSGLAAGKGVTVAGSFEEAADAVRTAFSSGDPGGVVLEERLVGRELSLLGITDGSSWKPLLLAQDYKHANEGDTGPMTGGMGAVAPADLLGVDQARQVEEEIVSRTLRGLQRDKLQFAGVIFIGLMVTDSGVKVLEYNTRFGDPETQSVLPLLESDLLELLIAACQGGLDRQVLRWSDRYAAGVVMAAPGYPGTPQTGIPLVPAEPHANLLVFHAGTSVKEGQLVSSGGRVLNLVGLGGDTESALANAYDGVRTTDFEGASWRSDIGLNLSR